MQLKRVGEFKLIDILAKQSAGCSSAVIRGIGDDAAVIQSGKSECLLVTTDMLTEGVHFRREYTSPYFLGRKSLAVNLSDIAAMGGEPRCHVVSLAVPPGFPLRYVKDLYRGMDSLAGQFGSDLVGGDTVAAPEGLSLSITAIGTARTDRVVYRNGARPGDLVYVSGAVGDSFLGLQMLQITRQASRKNALVKKHLDPLPRIELGRDLARRGLASAMIDISDGLVADLRHVLEQSGAGAAIEAALLPLSKSYRKYCTSLSGDLYSPALCGGEDYELLFTVRPGDAKKIARLAGKHGVSLTCIGEITPQAGTVTVLNERGRPMPLPEEGFTHF